MKSLSKGPNLDNKEFYGSYKRWKDLNGKQKEKTVAFYRELSPNAQSKVIEMAKSLQETASQEQNSRKEVTHKNDIARILHMYTDAELQTIWTKCFQPMSRVELDSKCSGFAFEDPWDQLAGEFNNYERNNYKNSCLALDKNGNPISPHIPLPGKQLNGCYLTHYHQCYLFIIYYYCYYLIFIIVFYFYLYLLLLSSYRR